MTEKTRKTLLYTYGFNADDLDGGRQAGNYFLEIHRPPVASARLVSYTANAEQTVCKVVNTYGGLMTDEDFSEEEVGHAFEDLNSTKLNDPAAMVHFVWLIKGVTRAFTHQLVRYAVGTRFAQESMRFYGAKKTYRVLATGRCARLDDKANAIYSRGVAEAVKSYHSLIGIDVPSEDARGVLPTNILTNIFFDCSLLGLKGVFTQRVCCQAQAPEWLPILMSMREQIRENMGDNIAGMLKANVELNRPCGYNASFDRPCTWRNGVPNSQDITYD